MGNLNINKAERIFCPRLSFQEMLIIAHIPTVVRSTTHLITKGQFTITYPTEKDAKKMIYGVGDRIDVDAGRVHEVWIGSEGWLYLCDWRVNERYFHQSMISIINSLNSLIIEHPQG